MTLNPLSMADGCRRWASWAAVGFAFLGLAGCGGEANREQAAAVPAVEKAGSATATGLANAQPVFRFAKISNGAYFYTGNVAEKNLILQSYPDFRCEGVAFYRTGDDSGMPVYRFANLRTGGYFYTASEWERDWVLQNRSDMRFEGSSFSVPGAVAGSQAVYRLANLNNGAYLYTASQPEAQAAVALGIWRDEGEAFRGAGAPANLVPPAGGWCTVSSPEPAGGSTGGGGSTAGSGTGGTGSGGGTDTSGGTGTTGGTGTSGGTTTPPLSNPGSTASVLCGISGNSFNASASVRLNSVWSWTCSGGNRALSANGVPDHDVGTFPNAGNPNRIGAVTVSASYTLTPALTAVVTAAQVPGHAINGVKFEPGTAGTCNDAGNNCNIATGGTGVWRIEALGQSAFNFGVDENNAHVQPTGEYHYHGMPEKYLVKLGKGVAMTLVGWAADGFPIYARYGYSVAGDARSALRAMRGSYQLKTVPDSGRPSINLYAMGTFQQDWLYVAGSGDLDECNGRIGVTPEFPNGTYHYLITDNYPFIGRCLKGTVATGAGGGAGGAGGAGGQPPPPPPPPRGG